MSRTRASAKKAGAAFERAMADYLAEQLGDDRIDRRVKSGAKDRGDIAGLRVFGERGVVECKNTRAMTLAAWINEAEVEAGNDDARHWVVVHKRRGVGAPGEQYVTMTVDQWLWLMRGGQ